MNVTISGRHLDVTDGLKGHIEERLTKLASHFDKVIDADVVLDIEKHRHIAEVNVHANGIRIHGKESSLDMYASVDAVLHKLERQCLKYKGRINRHKPRLVETIQSYRQSILSPAGGNGHLEEAESTAPAHAPVQHETLQMKHLNTDEAVLQLELTDDIFLVFYNTETSQMNVLYKHADGSFGLIEPHE